MSKYTWILDAGHGGIVDGQYATVGKRSPIWNDGTQYFEGVGNRNIVNKLIHKLKTNNIDCIDLLDGTQDDLSLQARVYRANKEYYSNKNCILISTHSNGFHKESANGYSIYTSIGETKSDLIATEFYKNMELYFPSHKKRTDYHTDNDIDKEANFYILKKTNCPAILIENFFMTNYRECKLLMSSEFVSKIVNCHFDSIKAIENNEAFNI